MRLAGHKGTRRGMMIIASVAMAVALGATGCSDDGAGTRGGSGSGSASGSGSGSASGLAPGETASPSN